MTSQFYHMIHTPGLDGAPVYVPKPNIRITQDDRNCDESRRHKIREHAMGVWAERIKSPKRISKIGLSELLPEKGSEVSLMEQETEP